MSEASASFGTNYIQTLEPRLYYVYTPYRDQTFAPIFDTAQADFGLAEIFTATRLWAAIVSPI